MENDITKRQVGLFIAFALIIVAIIVLIVLSFTSIGAKNNEPYEELETTSVKVVETNLALFYAKEGSYPANEEQLRDFINVNGAEDNVSYADIESSLKNLNYSPRGDGEAYRVTYENFKGEDKSFEGNYQNDYN